MKKKGSQKGEIGFLEYLNEDKNKSNKDKDKENNGKMKGMKIKLPWNKTIDCVKYSKELK
jgi:hypothetical protein